LVVWSYMAVMIMIRLPSAFALLSLRASAVRSFHAILIFEPPGGLVNLKNIQNFLEQHLHTVW
jgi:hypothetical protein